MNSYRDREEVQKERERERMKSRGRQKLSLQYKKHREEEIERGRENKVRGQGSNFIVGARGEGWGVTLEAKMPHLFRWVISR